MRKSRVPLYDKPHIYLKGGVWWVWRAPDGRRSTTIRNAEAIGWAAAR